MEEKLPLIFLSYPLLFTNRSLYMYIYTVPIDLMNSCAEALQLPQLLFGIGCVQHTGDKFRLGLRGTRGPRAAPQEVWEHLLTELCRFCFGQQKEPVLVRLSSCTLLCRHSCELLWHGALWRSSRLPHSPPGACSARNSLFCHRRNRFSM